MHNTKANILVVDDEAGLRTVLKRTLEAWEFSCRTASTVSEALLIVAEDEPDVVVSDIRMPGGDGTLLLKELQRTNPEIMVILLTAFAEVDVAIECLRNGASDFLNKPVRAAHLLTSIDRALERKRLIRENRLHQQELEMRISHATEELRNARDSISQSYRQTLEALSSALDARETETGDHSRRVMRLSLALAERLGFSETEKDDLAMGALLHDIGKIGIPDHILLKPGPLNTEEWALMRRHPEIGFDILRGIPFLAKSNDVVLSHHEAFDGSGYPQGLSGSEISLGARVFAVMDTLDAITHTRPYRPAQSIEAAFEEIEKCTNGQFDPKISEALFQLGIERITELADLKSTPAESGSGILIIDDNVPFRTFLARALSTLGYETTQASETVCLQELGGGDSPPPIVFLDWNLGEHTSMDSYLHLREMDIPVVIVTGDPDSVDSRVERILGKPFSLDTLRALLKEMAP